MGYFTVHRLVNSLLIYVFFKTGKSFAFLIVSPEII